MLEGLKRLFSAKPAPAARGWDGVSAWAESRQYAFRNVRDAGGFAIEGRLGALPWRMEWGPSQRHYIQSTELRLRAELGLPSELQVVVMNRMLQDQMERTVFDQYIEGVQTRIDNETPPEMRWLVMFPKLAGTEMGPLRERYVALASIKPFLLQWLEGPLTAALSSLQVDPKTPLVLMIGRGRLSLRIAHAEPDAADLEPWLRLFETAMREARRVASASFESKTPSTQPSLWSASAMPEDKRRK